MQVNKPLRKCRDCGLEAHTVSDLELFINARKCLYDKGNLCIKCQSNRYFERKYNPKPPKPKPTYLRKCRDCGLEAYTEQELEKFSRDITRKHGRRNLCRTCLNKQRLKPKPPYLRKCKVCGIEALTEADLPKFVSNKKCHYERGHLCQKCHYQRTKKYRNPLVDRYYTMIYRCHKETHPYYKHYGARGISVCKEWRENRQAFLDWARANGYKPELELDRRDNDGNYSPENCRWITHKEQCRNTRVNTTNWEKGTRICAHCEKEKTLSEFHKNLSRGPDGHIYICKPCKSTYSKKLRLKQKS